jgi:translation initiation factor 1
MPDDRRFVYSTDGSLPLPEPRRAKPLGSKPQAPPGVPDDGVVRVGCERRRGGSITLIYGLAISELAAIAAELKRRCGTGGTSKDGIVALQGDKRDSVVAYFAEQKRRVKRMGG